MVTVVDSGLTTVSPRDHVQNVPPVKHHDVPTGYDFNYKHTQYTKWGVPEEYMKYFRVSRDTQGRDPRPAERQTLPNPTISFPGEGNLGKGIENIGRGDWVNGLTLILFSPSSL